MAVAVPVLGILPATATAQVGVGVNVCSIQVSEPMFPGRDYHLPVVGVINTGHSSGDYSLRVVHRYQQEALKPPGEWFVFEPDLFHLEPDQWKDVDIEVRIPPRAQPGNYFAFIEAYSIPQQGAGLSVGVAVAIKLNFTVKLRLCRPALMFNKWLKRPADPTGALVDSSVSLTGQDALVSLSTIKGDDIEKAPVPVPPITRRPGVSGANICGGDYIW